MSGDLALRALRETDVQAVYEVAFEAWHSTYKDIYPAEFIHNFVQTNYAPAVSLRLVPRVQAGQQFFHVALVQSSVIGFCHIAETRHGMELLRIYLRPSYIGQGIGRALLQQGEDFIQAQGYSTYCCFVHKENDLGKNFYLRNGCTHMSEKDGAEEWYMEKRLGEPGQAGRG
jgi:ribosomal protein S18 acetylase RimI-like enzyme